MKKFIFTILFLIPPVFADRTISFTKQFTTTETILVCGGANYQCQGLRYHMISWALREGTMTDCHVKSQYALTDGGTKYDLNAAEDCSSGGASTIVNSTAPYIFLTTTYFVRNSGAAILEVTYAGWKDNPSPTVSVDTSTISTEATLSSFAGSITTPSSVVVTVQGNAGGASMPVSVTNITSDIAEGTSVSSPSQSPVTIGAEARGSADKAAVDAGDSIRIIADLLGRLIVLPFAQPDKGLYGGGSKTDTSELTILAADSTHLLYLTDIIITNTSATDTIVTVKDGTGGNVLFVIPAPAKSGAIKTWAVPSFKTTVNTKNMIAVSGDSVTTLYVYANGFRSVR